jgi:hypothetical protein
MQGCQPYLFGNQCPGATEIRLAFVQPWQGIGGAIVVRKIELGSVEEVVEVGVIVAMIVRPE